MATIDYGPQRGGLWTFVTLEQIRRHLFEQAQAWGISSTELKASSTIIAVMQQRLEIIRSITQIAEAPNHDLEVRLSDAVAMYRPVLLSSDLGQMIITELKQGNDRRAYQLAEVQPGSAKPLPVTNEKNGKTITAPKILASLDAVNKAISEALPASDELKREVKSALTLVDTIKAELTDLRTQSDAVLGESASALAEIKSQHVQREAEWEHVKAAYSAKLDLETTSDLWTKRATAHGKSRNTFGWILIAAGLLTPILTLLAAFSLFNTSGSFVGWDDGLAWQRTVFASAGTLLILTMSLWVTRIFVRLYMTEHHLHIDANARVALSQTYLALTSEGAAGSDDRKIVLAALFRPVNDGIVNDDALPLVSPAAIMSSYLSGDKPPQR